MLQSVRLVQDGFLVYAINMMGLFHYNLHVPQSTNNWKSTVLPAKSDSDVMYGLQSYQGQILDRTLVYQSYPQDRINTHVIYRFVLDQVECTS